VLEPIQERTTMTNLAESVQDPPCRTAWASPDERAAAINALVQHLLVHLPGLSAATQALSLTGASPKIEERKAS
jgi:hypothetical protein